MVGPEGRSAPGFRLAAAHEWILVPGIARGRELSDDGVCRLLVARLGDQFTSPALPYPVQNGPLGTLGTLGREARGADVLDALLSLCNNINVAPVECAVLSASLYAGNSLLVPCTPIYQLRRLRRRGAACPGSHEASRRCRGKARHHGSQACTSLFLRQNSSNVKLSIFTLLKCMIQCFCLFVCLVCSRCCATISTNSIVHHPKKKPHNVTPHFSLLQPPPNHQSTFSLYGFDCSENFIEMESYSMGLSHPAWNLLTLHPSSSHPPPRYIPSLPHGRTSPRSSGGPSS